MHMTEALDVALEPIRCVVMQRLEMIRLAALSLTPLVRVEEHLYAWGVSWSVSALANSASDEVVASVVVCTPSSDVHLEADVAYANTILADLTRLRFSTNDPQGIARTAEVVGEFLQRSVPCFMQGCQRMMDDETSGERR